VCFQRSARRSIWNKTSGCEIIARRALPSKADAERHKTELKLFGWTPCGAYQDAFLSESGDFFLKVHDSLKSCVAILKLGKVQGRLLRKSTNLELDRASTSRLRFTNSGCAIENNCSSAIRVVT